MRSPLTFQNPFKKQKEEGKTAQEKWGLHQEVNQTFVTMGYYKVQSLLIIESPKIDIRTRVTWAYNIFQLYRSFGRPWKNKQMKDRARGCEGIMAEWREDSLKLDYLEIKAGKPLDELNLDPHSEEYDIKVFALKTVIPCFLTYVGDCGGDEDIAPKDIAMFQTMMTPDAFSNKPRETEHSTNTAGQRLTDATKKAKEERNVKAQSS